MVGSMSDLSSVDQALQFIYGNSDNQTSFGMFLGNELNIWGQGMVNVLKYDLTMLTPEVEAVLGAMVKRVGYVGVAASFLSAYNSYSMNGSVNFSTLENIGMGLLTLASIPATGGIAVALALVALAWGLASSLGYTQQVYDWLSSL